jgi:phosphoribosylaminoimidazole carboxylase (NCAIR synthetase)
VDALRALEEEGMEVQPSSETIRLIQDKHLQKEHLRDNAEGIDMANFAQVANEAELEAFAAENGG